MNERGARIIAVASEKGGVGKTVTVLNLAAVFSKIGYKVLVVDMDPQFNATYGLGITLEEGMPSVYDLLCDTESVTPAGVIHKTRWEGLFLLPSHPDLSGAEVELVDEPGRENRLKEALCKVDNDYDLVLIDTPPSLSLLTINVFAYAEKILVPCQTQPDAFRAIEGLFDTISDIKEEINPDLSICGIVATCVDQRTRVSQAILDQLRRDQRYRGLVFDSIIRVNTTIAESALVRKPVVFYRPGSYGALDYDSLGREILKRSLDMEDARG